MRMPSHTTLCSFVFSLLLTSALIPSAGNVSLAAAGAPAAQMAVQTVLNGLRAQGFAGSAESILPSPAATPASASAAAPKAAPSLTPEVMGKMLKLIAEKGVDRDLIAVMANSLGLSASGQTWASRSISATSGDGSIHGFYISRGAEQDLVISLGVPGKAVYAYRTRRDGTATAAVVLDLQTRQTTMRSPDEAQKSLDAEVALWSGVVSNTATASNN